MAATLACWKCGADLKAVPRPFSRRAECPACHAELHVCRMCTLHNPRISDRCDDPRAEHPRDVERPNFCDYFTPSPTAWRPPQAGKGEAARASIDALFGGEAPASGGTDTARARLDEMFGGKGKK